MAMVFYVVISLLVGWIGRDIKFGFLFWFVLSLVLTPVITLLLLVILKLLTLLFVKVQTAAAQ